MTTCATVQAEVLLHVTFPFIRAQLPISAKLFLNVVEEPDLEDEEEAFGRESEREDDWPEDEWKGFLSEYAEDLSLDAEDVGGVDLAASSFMSQ